MLIHTRLTLEHVLKAGRAAPLVILDLDLRNAFPSIEWDAIRDAVKEHAPQLLSWTSWCHRSSADVALSRGDRASVDRGAEQGDPLGGVYCSLVLAGVAAEARAAVEEAGGWA